MSKYYYKKSNKKRRLTMKLIGASATLTGIGILLYVFFPFLSWQVYFAPVFASQNIETPIPKTTVVSAQALSDLFTSAAQSFGKDFTNANNWYPTNRISGGNIISEYFLSIPSIGIKNALISTKDSDLTRHMIQYNKDTVPPLPGNSVIFGHSTLPQLFDPNNYKTILANAYKVSVGDEILIGIKNISYKYKVQNITVVEPEDTSVLAQNFSDSFITIITCTPPGTVWKRLIIKATLVPAFAEDSR